MQSMILSLFVDGTMALLLCVTIFYCWKLNQRIRALQDGRSELAQTIREFDISTKRATQSIADIHEATQRISENMQHRIDKANFLADDLQYMIERGNKMLDKLDPGSASLRPPAKPAPKPTTPASGERVRSRAEKELADMLKNTGGE